MSRVRWFIIDQWFLIALLVLILISSQHQVPAPQQSVKHAIINRLTVAVIFLVNGCTTSTRLLLDNGRRWREHLLIQLMYVCKSPNRSRVDMALDIFS